MPMASWEASMDLDDAFMGAQMRANAAPWYKTAAAAVNNNLGPIMAAFGALQSGIGSYYSAKSTASSLEFQAEIAAINARMAERTAQSILQAGQDEQGRLSARAGQIKSKQKTRQAARGVQIGVGSAAEEVASTDIVKETDMLTINANAVRQAWAARTQSVNLANESLLKGTSAGSISPFSAMSTDLLTGATKVASYWDRNRKLAKMASLWGM